MGTDWIRTVSLTDLQRDGITALKVGQVPLALFWHNDNVHAVEDRCPHMGFPLSKGTIKDGILTCHWHQARFDLCSGCAFDSFADDATVFDTDIRDGIIYVAAEPRTVLDLDYFFHRLEKGMEQNSGFIIAKSLVSLRALDTEWNTILGRVADYGCRRLSGFGTGMTLLSITVNLMPLMQERTRFFSVFHSVRSIAGNSAGAAPRRPNEALPDSTHSPETLKRWYRQWVKNRHANGAERVLLTAIASDLPEEAFIDLFFSAVTDRVYPDGGHLLDAGNKVVELTDSVGSVSAADIFPLLTDAMAGGMGAEESAHWHQPVEIIEPLDAAAAELPHLLEVGAGGQWTDDPELVPVLLGDDPLAIIDAMKQALKNGATPVELSKRVAYAAALRLARFSLNNDVSDWFNTQHTFITANAVHQVVKRACTPDLVRGVLHSAMTVYMDRFLNVPPSPVPGENISLDTLPTDGAELLGQLLKSLDSKNESDTATDLAARYVQLELPFEKLINTLVYAVVREDLDFHFHQVLEAGVQQCREWDRVDVKMNIMAGVVRSLAARCPTARSSLKLAEIAMRLHQGEAIHE